MQVLLLFLVVVIIGAIRSADRDRPQRRWVLIGLCLVLSAAFTSFRLV